jgi:hypothetical protein
MRLFLSMLAGCLLTATLVAPVSAQKYDPYPWCAVYGGSMSGSSNCGFRTRQQCMATVSGVGGSCEPNQFYNPHGSRKGRHSSRPRED